MNPVPLDLPVRPAEAAELANLIFDEAERRPLSDELRNRLAGRASILRQETITPHFGSLERDPVHRSTYYLAVDAGKREPLLLHIALASGPTSSIFAKPLLIGRMRRANGPEMVINALPFGPSDSDNIERFASLTGGGLLPRPQGSRAGIVVTDESSFAAAFDAFRAILKRTGRNLAAIGSGRSAYLAGLWAAIRAGWRDEYSAAAEITLRPGATEESLETIRKCAACSRFVINVSPLLGREAALEEQFERSFGAEQRGWIFDEFARRFDAGDAAYELAEQNIVRLAVKFGPALMAAEQAHLWIRQARSALKAARMFDLELSLEGGGPTSAEELLFCLHWLKARGYAAQMAAPQLGGCDALSGRLKDLAAVALHYQATLSIALDAAYSPEDLAAIGRATKGRFLCRASAESTGESQNLQRIAGDLFA